jgi:membrane dipeptidase
LDKLPLLIGHNDTLLSLSLPERGQGCSFFERSDQGDIDLPRAREAGLAGGFFAVFVPQQVRESSPTPLKPASRKPAELREQPSVDDKLAET